MSPKRWSVVAGSLVIAAVGAWLLRPKPAPTPVVPPAERSVRSQAVAALGQLEPAGDIRNLAAPNAGMAGTPRVASLQVDEGDAIKQGQVLAAFDHRVGLLADLERVDAELRSLDQEIRLQAIEVERFTQAADWGAAELSLVDNKREELVRLQGQRDQALAERKGFMADLELSQLISPIDGVVLKLHAREGERPGVEGVMDVGANQAMQASIEVYESDIARISPDQSVRLTSENGGFRGELIGRVLRISPQVEQRSVLSTDPTGDADARVVVVDVVLNPEDAAKVSRLAGLKVIARFDP
ncbi:HlyD family efflux transporter periplasmic adaptor subunit [Synechococcus sp. MU1625]|uniref:HlyD family efflux transporter periplasmic adaptor subunit n=1 Tax=Synechococcus sp. MU1625 TaxID=2508347 RepID=UPI001CF8FACE|nr:HlyD family efflux transporter periplasmic adaptor subunit [Synechococcus sp. MU1625]MCB4398800.1 HlyD family efflux transporter periplasmic adaptor subunit [Synechococcus sp. MU1625]